MKSQTLQLIEHLDSFIKKYPGKEDPSGNDYFDQYQACASDLGRIAEQGHQNRNRNCNWVTLLNTLDTGLEMATLRNDPALVEGYKALIHYCQYERKHAQGFKECWWCRGKATQRCNHQMPSGLTCGVYHCDADPHPHE